MRQDRRKGSRRFLISAFSILLLCGAFFLFPGKVYGSEEIEVKELHMQGEITAASSLNVRSGPGKDYDKISEVGSGTVVTITGQAENGWYQIEVDGKTGFVSDQYVTATEIPAEEPEELAEEAGEPEEGYHGLHQNPFVVKMAVIGLGIVVVLGMLAVTVKNFRKDKDEEDDGDEDDEYADDEEYEDDEYADDGEYDEDDGGGYEEEYEDGEYDDDEYDDEYVDEEEDGEYAESDESAEDGHGDGRHRENGRNRNAGKGKKEFVLREEDYRVMIDPSFFEKEPIEQPAMVTGYLERKKIEEAARLKEAERLSEEAEYLSEEAEALKQERGEAGAFEGEKQKELDQAMAKLNELQKEIERLKNQKDE